MRGQKEPEMPSWQSNTLKKLSKKHILNSYSWEFEMLPRQGNASLLKESHNLQLLNNCNYTDRQMENDLSWETNRKLSAHRLSQRFTKDAGDLLCKPRFFKVCYANEVVMVSDSLVGKARCPEAFEINPLPSDQLE